MSDRRNALAVAIMAGTLIASELKLREERAQLVAIMEAHDVQQAPVRDVDGVELGKASLCGSEAKAKVADEAALLRWVKANRPDQVREVVEPAYIRALLKEATAEGFAVDESTGEVIPGIEIIDGAPFVKVTPNPTAKERMAELIEESNLLQLTTARRVVAEVALAPEPSINIEGLDGEDPTPW